MRESFTFHRSIYEAIRDLPRDVQGEIYTAIMEYGLYGNETAQLKPIARSIFTLVKPLLYNDMTRYENGSKGGRPKKPNQNRAETELKPNNNLNITEQKPNDNQSETSENTPIENNIIYNNLDNILDSDNILESDNNLSSLEIENNNSLSPLPSPSQAKKDEWDEEFERFWDMYGKKVGDKSKIQAKFLRLSKAVRLQIFRTLPAYIESTPDKKFRKNPETYLNNKSWNDEIINDNGSRQTQNPAFRQSADLSQFRDSSRHYETISDF